MSSFRIRPRFKHSIVGTQQQVEEKLKSALAEEELFSSSHLPGHLHVKIETTKQHFWSPQLHLSFEQDEDHVIVRGLYGPNPTLWAIFFFGYIVLGILSLFLGMWGLTRWSLGLSSAAFWSLPLFAVMAILLYFFAQTGQKLGAQQVYDIHHFYEKVINEKIHIG